MRTAIAILVAALGLTACGAPRPATWRGPTASPTPAPSRTVSPSASPAVSPTAAAGSDVKACFDGECLLKISRPKRVPLHRRFSLRTLSVTGIGDGRVTFQAQTTSGAMLASAVGTGGRTTLNGISIRVRSVDGHTAILEFSPAS